jgi:hypothetical protein
MIWTIRYTVMPTILRMYPIPLLRSLSRERFARQQRRCRQ